jgi:hypothetical protein
MTERTCSHDGCERAHFGRGMCSIHYNRWAYQLRKDPQRHAAFIAEREAAKAARLASADKPCSKCGVVKPKAEFSTTPRASDGRHSWCKACCRALANANYDPDRARAKHAEKKADPAYLAMKKTAYDRWRALHPDRARAATLRWRAANKDHVASVSRAWVSANRTRVRLIKRGSSGRRRKLLKSRRVGRVSFRAILARDGMVCHLCALPIAGLFDLHFDHVVPLARGGAHSMDNLKPAHAACNLRKGTKLVSELDWVVIRG